MLHRIYSSNHGLLSCRKLSSRFLTPPPPRSHREQLPQLDPARIEGLLHAPHVFLLRPAAVPRNQQRSRVRLARRSRSTGVIKHAYGGAFAHERQIESCKKTATTVTIDLYGDVQRAKSDTNRDNTAVALVFMGYRRLFGLRLVAHDKGPSRPPSVSWDGTERPRGSPRKKY